MSVLSVLYALDLLDVMCLLSELGFTFTFSVTQISVPIGQEYLKVFMLLLTV